MNSRNRTVGDRVARFLGSVVVWAITVFIVMPLLAVVYVSFGAKSYFVFPPAGFSLHWYANIAANPIFLTSFVRSVLVGLLVVALAGVLAVPAAVFLSRTKFKGRDAIVTFLMAPMLLPSLVLALALLAFFTLLNWNDTLIGLVVSHTVVTLPYFMRSVLVSLTDLDPALFEASEILGASPLSTFRYVVLPLVKPGVMAGAIFSFILSFDQFTISLFVVGYRQVTLPIALYNYLTQNSDPTVAAVSTLLVLFGVGASLLLHRLVGLDNLFSGR